MQNTFKHSVSVLSHNRKELEVAFQKLVEKAKKMELAIPTMTYVGKETKIKSVVTIFDGEREIREVEIELSMYEIDAIETFKFNGWSLIATVLYQESNVDLQNEEYDYPEQYGLKFNKCEHCGHSHPGRVKSFIVQHENGEFKQVGSTCVKDFLGVSVSVLTKLQESLCEVTIIKYDDGEEPSGFRSNLAYMQWLESRKVFVYNDVLRAAKQAFDKDGRYVKKEYLMESDRWGNQRAATYPNGEYIRTNLGKASVDEIERIIVGDGVLVLDLPEDYITGLNEYLSKIEVPMIMKAVCLGDDDFDETLDKEGNGIYFVSTGEEDTDSFNYKMRSLADKTRIRRMDFWAPAYAVHKYEQHLEYQRKLAENAHLDYLGNVNDKVNFEVTIKDIKTGESVYGTWTLYIMETAEGNAVTKFGTIGMQYIVTKKDGIYYPEVGDVVKACAPITACELKHGIKTTMLGRLSKYNVKLQK